jgi:hypothetical protein
MNLKKLNKIKRVSDSVNLTEVVALLPEDSGVGLNSVGQVEITTNEPLSHEVLNKLSTFAEYHNYTFTAVKKIGLPKEYYLTPNDLDSDSSIYHLLRQVEEFFREEFDRGEAEPFWEGVIGGKETRISVFAETFDFIVQIYNDYTDTWDDFHGSLQRPDYDWAELFTKIITNYEH